MNSSPSPTLAQNGTPALPCPLTSWWTAPLHRGPDPAPCIACPAEDRPSHPTHKALPFAAWYGPPTDGLGSRTGQNIADPESPKETY